MTEQTTTDTPASTPAPEATADELDQLRAQLAETAKSILADVPEHLRGLIPATLSPADQIAWFNQAKATGAFKPAVPTTESGKPAITPRTPDTSALPVYARLAAGYAK